MSHAITRCPKCATSFRITQNQLKTAKGAVRCGSCLTVFQAGAHLIREAVPEVAQPNQKPPVRKSAPQSVKASGVKAAQASAVLPAKTKAKSTSVIESTAVREAVKTPPRKAAVKSAQPKQNQLQRGQPKQAPKQPQQKAYEQAKHQPSDVDNDDILISDDMDGDASHFDEVTNELQITGTSRALSHSLFERDPTKRVQNPDSEDDDSWALSLLDDQEVKADRRHSNSDKTASDDEGDIDLSGKSIYSQGDDFEFHDDFKEAAGVEAVSPPQSKDHARAHVKIDPTEVVPEELPVFEFDEPLEDRESDTNIHLFSGIEPEPVDFSYKRKRPIWRSRGLFAVLSIVCMLALITQGAIMRFDTLALKEPYRGVYKLACSVMGCELPKLTDKSKIRITQLIVRSHPTTAKALIVDAVILNNATFNQDFPDLTLTFTDMQNKPISSRTFAPREYLDGELKGYKLMPSLQPISLNFQIVDPGAKAVNYLLTIAQ